MNKPLLRKLFISIITITILAQSLSPYVVYSQVYAKKATDSAELITPTLTPSLTPTQNLTPTPTVTPTITPALENNLTATPTETLTPTPTPTVTVKSQETVQSASLTPAVYDNYLNLPGGSTYDLQAGQRVMITGDVKVDGLDWFDDQENTVAVDVILDGKTHSIVANYGATLDLFTSDATLDYINQRYTDNINTIKSGGKTIDLSSVNQLDPNWQLPNKGIYKAWRYLAGESYDPTNIGASWGQKIIITGDAKIDGIAQYDSSDSTLAVDVLTDGKQHLIEFPWGGTVLVFSLSSTDQFVQDTYNSIVGSIVNSGKRVDPNSLNQLTPTQSNWVNITIQPGKTYQLPQGLKAFVFGDVAIDNVDTSFNSSYLVNYYDDRADTVSLDAITDNKAHNIYSEWGTNLLVFTATSEETQTKYNELKNNIISSGKSIDPTNLNQLLPSPQLAYMIPTVSANGTYNVPTGQRIMIFGDVIIDGRKYFDSDSTSGAIDVLMDGQAHTIVFPYGGSARVFTNAATTQYIQWSFVKEQNNLQTSGLRYDVNSWLQLINIPQFP